MPLEPKIEALEKKHALVDASLHAEEVRPLPDMLRLRSLKRHKLVLKDQISRLRGKANTFIHERRAGK